METIIIQNLSNYDILENGIIINISNQKIQPQRDNGSGYQIVTLLTDNEKCYKNFYVHRLVAIAFIPNPNNFYCVNHKDENKKNNNVNNLEWCDYKYNNNYGTRNEKMIQTKQKQGYTIPKTAVKIIMKDKKTKKPIKIFSSIKEAGRFLNKSPSHINEAVHQKRKSAYGYLWEKE